MLCVEMGFARQVADKIIFMDRGERRRGTAPKRPVVRSR
ncbi:ABC-type polar amino acid transport system ATPase subunit [Mesorhizobium shonense]|uniref:ABC-type polar amino acid transport system ATPase subunit n=1 Tax=Mesorhizobium shonense TaxID=1209948 RepID=A0ABV2HV13_9HYPH